MHLLQETMGKHRCSLQRTCSFLRSVRTNAQPNVSSDKCTFVRILRAMLFLILIQAPAVLAPPAGDLASLLAPVVNMLTPVISTYFKASAEKDAQLFSMLAAPANPGTAVVHHYSLPLSWQRGWHHSRDPPLRCCVLRLASLKRSAMKN